MTQSGARGHALDILIKQSIPLFGKKSIAEALGMQDKLTIEAQSKKQRLLLSHEVAHLSYRLAALEEQTTHVAHRREKLSLIASYLKTRPFASPAKALEKGLLLNRLREIEEKFLEISSAREGTWQALNLFLASEFKISPEIPWKIKPSLPSRETLRQFFQTQNPELERQQSLIARSSLEIKQAEKSLA